MMRVAIVVVVYILLPYGVYRALFHRTGFFVLSAACAGVSALVAISLLERLGRRTSRWLYPKPRVRPGPGRES